MVMMKRERKEGTMLTKAELKNKSCDLINKHTPGVFLHKILIIFTRFGEQKGAVEYFKINGNFFRILYPLIVARE